MEEQKPISHIIAGLIIAGILIIFSMVLYYTGTQQGGIYQVLQLLVIVIGLIVFINMYGKANKNQVSFGNLFSYGFKTATVLTLVMITFTVLFFLLFPDIKEKLFETTREQMEKRDNMTPEEIDKGMEMWQNMFWVFTIGGTLLIYAIVGAIASAIGAAITKKKPVNPLDQLDMR
jgi:NADH:ubiquinone oxidoreductase subunit 6 (subunit J)